MQHKLITISTSESSTHTRRSVDQRELRDTTRETAQGEDIKPTQSIVTSMNSNLEGMYRTTMPHAKTVCTI